jgi:putative endonuclease
MVVVRDARDAMNRLLSSVGSSLNAMPRRRVGTTCTVRVEIVKKKLTADSEIMCAIVDHVVRMAWKPPMLCVYILRCGDGSLYTGAAKDLERRLAQHAAGRASRYTRARLPVTLVWSHRTRSWSDALRIERRVKALARAEKDALVGGGRLPRRPRAAQAGTSSMQPISRGVKSRTR